MTRTRIAATSRTARLAALFRASPGQWREGRDLATVAGAYAWRTRVGPHLVDRPQVLTLQAEIGTCPVRRTLRWVPRAQNLAGHILDAAGSPRRGHGETRVA